MRYLLRESTTHLDENSNEVVVEHWYAGRGRDGVRWAKTPAEAWDFGTRLTAESIRDRDSYLRHCEIVEMR